jgi:hypothetical protein
MVDYDFRLFIIFAYYCIRSLPEKRWPEQTINHYAKKHGLLFFPAKKTGTSSRQTNHAPFL